MAKTTPSKADIDYWRERNLEREQEWNNKTDAFVYDLQANYYEKSLGVIQSEIYALYAKFAEKTGLTLADCKKLLKGSEYREWRMSLEEYVDAISKSDDKGLRLELETLAMRSRVSRLDALLGNTLIEIDKLGRNVEKKLKAHMKEAYKDTYGRTMYEKAHRGLSVPFAKLDNKAVETAIRTPWKHGHYSEHIWGNTTKLANTINQVVVGGVSRGEGISTMSRNLRKTFEVSKSDADRLVRTEASYIQNKAILDQLIDEGAEYLEFVAVLDNRTSATCASHDGAIIPVAKAVQGDNVPPLHARCRSTVIEYYDRDSKHTKTRIARGATDEYVYIPESMTYNDFKGAVLEQSKPLPKGARVVSD